MTKQKKSEGERKMRKESESEAARRAKQKEGERRACYRKKKKGFLIDSRLVACLSGEKEKPKSSLPLVNQREGTRREKEKRRRERQGERAKEREKKKERADCGTFWLGFLSIHFSSSCFYQNGISSCDCCFRLFFCVRFFSFLSFSFFRRCIEIEERTK